GLISSRFGAVAVRTHGQVASYNCSTFRPIVSSNFSAMLVHGELRDGQTEPRSSVTKRKKRLESAPQSFGGKPSSRILDYTSYPHSVRVVVLPHFNRNVASRGRVLDRIL